MSRPKVFVGSSQKNLRVAKVLAEGLEDELQKAIQVVIWNEGVFGLNRGVLEDLLDKLDEFDFAVLILAGDDLTYSKDELKPSTRDNVLFECGLFMGRLGRDRVFVVCDESLDLKIPSDFGGVTLARYDGSRIEGREAKAAVSTACRLIGDAIRIPLFEHIIGEWRSKYRLTGVMDHPLTEEDVDIQPCQGRLCITTKTNSQNDYYVAQANWIDERFLLGRWKATHQSGSMSGVFMLTITPKSTIMYGYATGMDENGATLFGTWVLAKKDGVDEETLNERLRRGEELLKGTLLTWELPNKKV